MTPAEKPLTELRISNQGNYIENLVFADGRVIHNIALDDGSSRVLAGNSSNDLVLSLGTQFQYLQGGAGDDVYVIDSNAADLPPETSLSLL